MKNYSIVSMSKVYESEDFYKPFLNNGEFIDCSDISGINCYADDIARRTLETRLENIPVNSIHFIDSGNFHYLSYLFLSRIEEDFELVLFDKHPDCKAPMFEEFLSCGGWVREVLFNLPHLKKVYMIGIDESLLYELDDLYDNRDRVEVISSYDLFMGNVLSKTNLPVYISLDKDVLSEDEVTTNWDQGEMTFAELTKYLEAILDRREVLGIDICGEPDIHEAGSVFAGNSRINTELLKCISRCREKTFFN